MEPVRPRGRPEDLIVQQLKSYLKTRDWLTKKTHGNEFSIGWPDLYCAHKRYGQRWIECKTKKGNLEGTQIEFFKELAAVGVGVWILTEATEEQYQLLFGSPNWIWYLPGMGIKKLL